MPEMLPRFKYHPDPLATGSVQPSDATCGCCGRTRGYVYTAAVYAIEAIQSVCPWCIADGTLEMKYDARLSDDLALHAAGVSNEIIHEVTRRTPGYISWQQDRWIACCNDACEFHGDAPVAEIKALDERGIAALAVESGFPIEDLRETIAVYQTGGSPAFYKFVCKHCSRVKYNGDCD